MACPILLPDRSCDKIGKVDGEIFGAGGAKMARICYVTGKRPGTGNKRSHAENKTRRRWGVNVQKVRILVDGKPKRVYVSARALRSGKVKRV